MMKTELVTECKLCGGATLTEIDPACNIAECKTCGYIFHNVRPTSEQLVEFYSKPTQYDSWLQALDLRDVLWKRRLRKLRPISKSGTLLDVGTGIGQFLAVARGSYSGVYGTEVSRAAVRIAKERYGLDLFEGDVHALKARELKFDNITLFHVLEHVPDPKSVLDTCHSLLSEGGVLAIAVPNEVASLRSFTKRVLISLGLKKADGPLGLHSVNMASSEVHLSYFTPKALRRALKNAGFSDIKNSADPYYVVEGAQKVRADLYCFFCDSIARLLDLNLYDAILVTGRKVSPKPVKSLTNVSP